MSNAELSNKVPTTVKVQRRDYAAILLEGRAFIALIVLIIIFSLLSDSFLTANNLVTMTKHVAMNAILALGMLFVILKGGIDLSIGSTVGLSGVVAGVLLQGLRIDSLGIRQCGSLCSAHSRSAHLSGSSTEYL
jgi:erythritol transport system permease protein